MLAAKSEHSDKSDLGLHDAESVKFNSPEIL